MGSTLIALRSVINELLDSLSSHATVIVPVVREMTFGSQVEGKPVPMVGPEGGVVVDRFDEFPDSLRLWFYGKIVVGSQVRNPPSLSSLQVMVQFPSADNPALSGRVQASIQAEADGSFAVSVGLVFDTAQPKPWRLNGRVSIVGTTLPTEDVPIKIENATLNWFLSLVDGWEQTTPVADRLEFLTKMRKTLLPSGDFNFALRRYNATPALFSQESYWALRLKAGYHVRFEGEAISVSHVLIGIEGGKRQKPELPPFPIPRVDLLVTWAGDLGGALGRYLFAKYILKSGDAKSLIYYIERTASRADLIGDVDGVNLAATYDQRRSISQNFLTYYGLDSQRRFSRFLENTKTDAGDRALALEPGVTPPRLSLAARQFITGQIVQVASAILFRRIILPDTQVPKEKRQNIPPGVEAALNPNSQEAQNVTKVFVDLLEDGLAKESLSQR